MPYVEWAVNNHITSGIGYSQFGPEQTVSREQMAGVINGKSGSKFEPKTTATRAEVCGCIMKMGSRPRAGNK